MSTSRPGSAKKRVSAGPKKDKVGPYESPFIAKAQARALERAKVVNKHLPRSGFIKNEWDETPKSPGGLFDPSVRKKEIFKLEPRRVQRAEGRNSRDIDISGIGRDSQNSYHRDGGNERPQTTSPRMTVRTRDTQPQRKPNVPSSPSERHSSPRDQRSHSPHSPHNPYGREDQHSPQHQHEPHYASPRHGTPPPPPPSHPPPPSSSSSHHHQHHHHPSSRATKLTELEEKLKDKHHEHYGNLIRERLRTLLQQRMGGLRGRGASTRGAEGDEDEEQDAEAGVEGVYNFPPRRPRRILRSTSSYYETTQQTFMRDMMASMANMMTAVGHIVSGVGEHRKVQAREKYFHNTQKKMKKGGREEYGGYLNQHVYDNLNTHTYSHPYPHPAAHPNATPTSPTPNAHPGAYPTDPCTTNLAYNLAHQGALLQRGVKGSRAGVLDAVLTKLQQIEQTEREMAEYLKMTAAREAESGRVYLEGAKQPDKDLVVQSGGPDKNKERISSMLKDLQDKEKARLRQHKNDAAKENVQLPTVKLNLEDRNEMERYMQDLAGARKLREVVYTRGGTSLSEATDMITDALMEKMLRSVSQEVDHIFATYSEKFLHTI